MPRPEILLLLLALLWTVGAKLVVVRRYDPSSVLLAWADVSHARLRVLRHDTATDRPSVWLAPQPLGGRGSGCWLHR